MPAVAGDAETCRTGAAVAAKFYAAPRAATAAAGLTAGQPLCRSELAGRFCGRQSRPDDVLRPDRGAGADMPGLRPRHPLSGAVNPGDAAHWSRVPAARIVATHDRPGTDPFAPHSFAE